MQLVTQEPQTVIAWLYIGNIAAQVLPTSIRSLRGNMQVPKHWKIFLEELGEFGTGDVIALETGEVLGKWSLIDDVYYAFTPEGAEKYIFFEPFFGMLCLAVREWYESKAVDH
ncbi:hypothetical protein FZC33_00200 [Labrys sp. KNU-23]|uniref:hypothetical protein n=1 Tax=Labrys sp. KNU-23 TaxID=2789216 RepID=UPI0011F0550E|nr:hypothetical protein [Labrys sp. KNU-23]QEN84750.1 hypothetical protein FZC33_00200 [Labrys sp. KNU-23]